MNNYQNQYIPLGNQLQDTAGKISSLEIELQQVEGQIGNCNQVIGELEEKIRKQKEREEHEAKNADSEKTDEPQWNKPESGSEKLQKELKEKKDTLGSLMNKKDEIIQAIANAKNEKASLEERLKQIKNTIATEYKNYYDTHRGLKEEYSQMKPRGATGAKNIMESQVSKAYTQTQQLHNNLNEINNILGQYNSEKKYSGAAGKKGFNYKPGTKGNLDEIVNNTKIISADAHENQLKNILTPEFTFNALKYNVGLDRDKNNQESEEAHQRQYRSPLAYKLPQYESKTTYELLNGTRKYYD